jgi:hypothetical protein
MLIGSMARLFYTERSAKRSVFFGLPVLVLVHSEIGIGIHTVLVQVESF